MHDWVVSTRLRLDRTTKNNHSLSFNSFKRTSMDNARLRFWLLTNFLVRHLELLRLLVTCKNLGGFFNPFKFLVFAVIYQENFDLNTNRYPWHMPGISADIRGICPGYRQISVAYAQDIGRYPWLLYPGHMPRISADILGPLPRI